jgi:multisubunit Na+/H+ antiporter MnhG subunit
MSQIMAKYKKSTSFCLLTISLIIITLILTAIFKGAKWTAIFLVIAVIFLILFWPILIMDIRNASTLKEKEKEEKKKLDVRKAELEIEKEKLELEKLKLKKGIVEESGNYCKYCGETIQGTPKICPHCGSSLSE